MIRIENGKFPIHAKNLGIPLIAYCLGLEKSEVETLITEGGSIDSEKYNGLQQLNLIMLEAKKGRIQDSLVQPNDLSRLTHIQFIEGVDGTRPFNTLHKKLCDTTAQKTWCDPVMAVLARWCEECFPYCLLPIDDGGTTRFYFPNFYNEELSNLFNEAILADPLLKKLFYEIGENPAETRGLYFTSMGHSASFQLSILPDCLIQNANILMRIYGELSLEAFQHSMQRIVNTIRVSLQGGAATLPVAYIFDSVGLPAGTKVNLNNGRLVNIPNAALDLLPRDIRKSIHRGNRILGCMFITEVDFGLYISQVSIQKYDFTQSWPIKKTNQEYIGTLIEKIPLITALSIETASPIAARVIFSIDIDPLSTPSMGRENMGASMGESLEANSQQIENLTKWTSLIEKTDNEKIRVAIRRLLSAIVERDNPIDGVIDAVIGLENLFGERNEISFTIASCVSILLENEKEQRENLFSEMKNIYNIRSKLVHGSSKSLKGVNFVEIRNSTILILSRCLRVLFELRPELIPLKSADRVKQIILRSNEVNSAL